MTGTEFPYRDFMQKELSLVVSRSYGPGRYDHEFEGRGVKYPEGWVRWTETENLAESVRLMSPARASRLDVGALITHHYPFDQAETAYGLVTGAGEPHLGVVLEYAGDTPLPSRPAFPAPTVSPGTRGCVLGVIGAGAFARAVLLPGLKRLPGVTLDTVVTRRGATAQQAAETFGFRAAETDPEAVFANPDINAVLVATRHDSHAGLAARALAAGKPVLVEKPLALNQEQLDQVIEAREGSSAFFQVGFNRRFAPMAMAARRHLEAAAGPRFVLARINAGALPDDSWIIDAAQGGGRVLGEVCHFVDLARYFVGHGIAEVSAQALGPDDVAATLHFTDGSLATIAYTTLGDTTAPKELFEGFAGGTVFRLDDFKTPGVPAPTPVAPATRASRPSSPPSSRRWRRAARRRWTRRKPSKPPVPPWPSTKRCKPAGAWPCDRLSGAGPTRSIGPMAIIAVMTPAIVMSPVPNAI